MNYKSMTKQDLILHCKELQEEVDRLESELEDLDAAYVELEHKNAILADKTNAVSIKNIHNFQRELDEAGMLTDELERFIERYMVWNND